LVIVIEPAAGLVGAEKVPTALPGVALVVMAKVFDPPLAIEIEVLAAGEAEKVPIAFEPVPLFVSVSVFGLAPEELVIVIEPAPGPAGAENVPTALPAVASVVMANVFDPLVIETEVLAAGEAENVPIECEPLPLFVRVNMFAPLVIVREPPDNGGAEKLPVWDAAVAGLALSDVPSMVIVPPLAVEENVPIRLAATA